MTRRVFVRMVPSLGVFALASDASAQATRGFPAVPPGPGAPVDDSFPSHHPALAQEVVGASHANIARVKELVTRQPTLAQASWDWGYGDWETAIGAASHTGQREIARLLIDHGAQPTIFTFAMLGQIRLVEAYAASLPPEQRARLSSLRGPHSLSLLSHARAGGAEAAAVVTFLESLGPEEPLPNEPVSAEDRAAIEGRYTFGSRDRDTFVVGTDRNNLQITRAGAVPRNLRHMGRLEFFPVGAPTVRIRFERSGARVTALTVNDPDVVVRATKA